MMELPVFLFVVGRVLLGGYFIMNAINHFKDTAALAGYAQSKGVKMPRESVIVTGLMLLVGGVGVLLGIYVELALGLLALFLLLSSFMIHRYWKISDPMQRMVEEINFKKNLALMGAILMLYALPLPWMMILR